MKTNEINPDKQPPSINQPLTNQPSPPSSDSELMSTEDVKFLNRVRVVSQEKNKTVAVARITLWKAIKTLKANGGSKGGKAFERRFGYPLEKLVKTIESRWADDMTWSDYGRNGWSLTHVVPIAMFDFKSKHDPAFRQCFYYTNIAPQWKEHIDTRKRFYALETICSDPTLREAMDCGNTFCEDCCFGQGNRQGGGNETGEGIHKP